MESLGDFVRRIRNEKRLSCKDVEKRSARYGRPISGAYVNRIENFDKLNPTAERLIALADGLGVPREELLALSAGIVPSNTTSDELHLVSMFRELSPHRKMDVTNVVDMWYSEERQALRVLTLVPNRETKQ